MISFFKKAVGINIADHTVEVVTLVKRGGRAKVTSLARTVLIPGIVEQGKIKDVKKLTRILKGLFAQAQPNPIKPKKIFFTLPESQVYTHVFSVEPYTKKDNIEDLVVKEASTHIPLMEDDLLYSYKIIDIRKGKGTVLMVAANRQVVVEWQEFFKGLGVEVEDFDIETLANYRDLFLKRPKKPVCLVDIGASATNIAIFDKRGLRYSHSFNIAGNRLTTRVARNLGITKEEAEKKKIKFGLVTRNNEMYTILARGVNDIFKEIMNALSYYHESNKKKKISQVMLLGGSSQLRGLVEYLHSNLNLPVIIGVSQLTRKSVPLEYITAIGSALRGVNNKWRKTDPVIHLSAEEQQKEKKEKAKKVKEAAKMRKEKKKGHGKIKPKIKHKSAVIDVELGMDEAEMEEDEDFSLASINEAAQEKKLLWQKIALIIILVGGLSGVFFAYRFRSQEKIARKEALNKTDVAQLTKIQSFEVSVEVVIKSSEKTEQNVAGRIINDIIQMSGSYAEALANSSRNAKKALQEGEVVWPIPLNPLDDPGAVVFPLSLKWLAYNELESNKLLLAEIDKLNYNKVDYSLNNMEKTGLVVTDKPTVFDLQATVTVSVDELIKSQAEMQNENSTTAGETVIKKEATSLIEEKDNSAKVVDKQKIVIGETGLGWLNARSGPGTTYEVVVKVNSGDEYFVLEQQNGWTKIKIDNQEAWIINTYIEPVE